MSLLERFRLDGKTALVTGGSRGIGRGIALAFAEAGANVVIAARQEEAIQAALEDIQALGTRALGISCNVARETELQPLIDNTLDTFGRLDILVNNAGGAYPNDFLSTDGEQLDRDFHFNVTAAFNLCRLATPHLRAHEGSIINITSAAARYCQKGFTNYGTVKAALTHLTRLLAADLAPSVRVNGIAPGSILTEALGQFLDADTQARMTALTPMGRLGSTDDIAAAALYLASPAGGWVTGKILEVDGGAESTTWPF